MDSVTWQRLVSERNEWVAKNFPGPDMPNTMLGVIEEMGELVHHHLKEDQNIRGDDKYHQDEAQDAIGDLVVYLLGVMNFIGYVPNYGLHPKLEPQVDASNLLLTLASEVGDLARRPSQYDVNRVLISMMRYCSARGWDFDQIVLETWDKVKQRDWTKDRMAGGEVV